MKVFNEKAIATSAATGILKKLLRAHGAGVAALGNVARHRVM